MEIAKLNNVGRKFPKFINNNERAGSLGRIGGFRHPTGDFWALRNIYMSIHKGEIVGVIGRNGAGKTTLLNIITGSLPVSEGQIQLRGKVSALLTLGAGFQDEFSGKENIRLYASLLGWGKQKIEKRFMDVLEFSELGDFINAPLGSYSAGMKMRLGFSVAIHDDFDILLTDEILAVGDIYFQKKCFEKMMEFKKQGKAMFIVTQDMGMIERFCDRTYLLEDGKVIFDGVTREAIERYEMLLNKKKILSESARLDMVKDTKRWATDITEWGKREGTREVEIKDVVILNKWKVKVNKVKTHDKLKIRARFEAREEIDNFHFGVAIFREDGVYCYGPNTKFDGLPMEKMHKGEGYFELECKALSLMPGIYYASVAVWDENETFAYAYHRCNYKIEIIGEPLFGQLLSMVSFWGESLAGRHGSIGSLPNLDHLVDKWGTELKNDAAILCSIKCLDNYGGEDSVFITGRDMKIKIEFEAGKSPGKGLILWVGIYRSDGIYCHGNMKNISSPGINSEVLVYPKLKLLPGGYRVSAGIWEPEAGKFLAYSHGVHAFNMISDKRDHGTIYLEHCWNLKIP